ncbi:MAG TPA: hypothetical protein VMS43_12945 [Allosphingosinicella sp.]|nr:hypothetical protein [Allosphingosinicella sp.]
MTKPEELIEAYEALRPQYEALTSSLDTLLRTLLGNASIEYFSVEPRTKEMDSFSGKVRREEKKGKYKKLADVTDLSGVRIIAYLQEECDRISQLIEDNFSIDEENSARKEDELDPDKFGYLSTHYVISLTDNRTSLPEFSRYSGMKAELQIRTLLQHTWAAIDWRFRYKGEREAPKPLRRRLFRISALLEAADNEFSGVKVEIDSLRQQYSEEIVRGELGIAINSESVRSYAEESSSWRVIVGAGRKAGIKVPSGDPGGMFKNFIGTANILGIDDLAKLDAMLRQHAGDSERFFSEIAPIISERRAGVPAYLYDTGIVRYFLFSIASAAHRKQISADFPWADGLEEALSSVPKPKKA